MLKTKNHPAKRGQLGRYDKAARKLSKNAMRLFWKNKENYATHFGMWANSDGYVVDLLISKARKKEAEQTAETP